MNKMKKTFTISISLIIMLSCFIVAFSLFGVNAVNAQVSLSENVTFKDSYSIGQTLSIPDAYITINGNECETYKVVYYPNGKVYKTNSVVLKDNGIYKKIANLARGGN